MENLNSKDRIIRTSMGAISLLSMLAFATTPLMITALSLAAMYPLLTALLAWDPVYHVLLTFTEALTKSTKTEEVPSIAEKVRL